MNTRTRKKLIIDFVMSVLYLLLMNLTLTGIAWHEVIGIGIPVLFAAHLLFNRQWIRGLTTHFRSANRRGQTLFLLGGMLGLSMAVTIGSGIRLSQVLFPALAAAEPGAWYVIHVAASWTTLLLLLVHAVLHGRWLMNLIRQLKPADSLRAAGAKLSLLLIATTAVYSLLNVGIIGRTAAVTGTTESTAASLPASAVTAYTASGAAMLKPANSADSSASLSSQGTASLAEAADETLQQYLSRLTCTACGRHCPLTSPRCSRGKAQVEQATADYNATLAVQMTTNMTLV